MRSITCDRRLNTLKNYKYDIFIDSFLLQYPVFIMNMQGFNRYSLTSFYLHWTNFPVYTFREFHDNKDQIPGTQITLDLTTISGSSD